jgi:hypothetical protein
MAASFTLSMGEETDLSRWIHDLLLSKIPPPDWGREQQLDKLFKINKN